MVRSQSDSRTTFRRIASSRPQIKPRTENCGDGIGELMEYLISKFPGSLASISSFFATPLRITFRTRAHRCCILRRKFPANSELSPRTWYIKVIVKSSRYRELWRHEQRYLFYDAASRVITVAFVCNMHGVLEFSIIERKRRGCRMNHEKLNYRIFLWILHYELINPFYVIPRVDTWTIVDGRIYNIIQ